MNSALETIFNQIVVSQNPITIGIDVGDDISNCEKIKSYFNPKISFYLKETPLMSVVSKIQTAKKAQLKIENWDASEIQIRLEKIESIVRLHSSEIASLEAHFQGTTKKFQNQWAVQPVLDLIKEMLISIKLNLNIERALPKGLIGAITPRAQSFFEIGWRILYAIYHKDSLVLKPASETALSARLWTEILTECELPEGLIVFVFGSGKTVGKFLLDHPGVRNLSFSGSYETLRSFPMSLEKKYQFFFNGKNSVCVLADCDISTKIESIAQLFIEHNGKGIFSPARLFLVETMEKEFKSLLREYLEKVPNLKSIDDDFGFLPLKENEKLKLNQYRAQFENEDSKLIFESENFLFYSELPNCSELHQENLELPIFNLTSVKYAHEMLRWVNNNSFGHSLFIFGSEEKSKKLALKAEVGKVFLNPSPLHYAAVNPIKQSGFGNTEYTLPNSFFSYCKKFLE